jgi:hypothetical protein
MFLSTFRKRSGAKCAFNTDMPRPSHNDGPRRDFRAPEVNFTAAGP